MIRFLIFFHLLCIRVENTHAQNKLVFISLEEVYFFAETHSSTFQNAIQQNSLAKYLTLVAKFEVANMKGPSSFTLTDNIKLGTNFIPAEVFGGAAGTFRSITFGQKYESNFTFEPQFDLINPYKMAQIRVFKTNEQLTTVNNLLAKKSVYESISAVYHNIYSYQWQIDITTKSLVNADTLVVISSNKQKEGLSRSQDVNIAMANQLAIGDKLQQLKIQLEQQYNNLRVLCDIDPLTSITIIPDTKPISQFNSKANGDLLQQQAEWQIQYQHAILRADKRWPYPTLSLFGSMSWQENSNVKFFGSNNWLRTSFIGLKLSMPFLPDVSKIAAVKSDRLNLEIARNNWNHRKLQDQINNNQLELNYRKATESYKLAAQVEALRRDNYLKNLNIYREGLISTTDIIKSFDDWLNSSLNTVVMSATAEYTKSMIIISNAIK